jgi:2-dehydropantoate 2-reductase
MRVLVIGAGAVGAFYASKIPSKHHVSVICRSNYSAVKSNGFEIHSKDSIHVFKPDDVYSALEECTKDYDLIIIATKADQFIDLSGFVENNPVILIIQNGLGVEDYYAEKYPDLCILSAVTVISCAQTSPGVITHYSWTRIHIGPFITRVKHDIGMKYANIISEMFKESGIHDAMVCDSEELQMIRWHKLAINAAFNPTAVLSDGKL